MEATKRVAVQLDDDGFPFALVTGEQQPGQRKVIARLDGPGNLSKKERAEYATNIVRAVNTFDQAREALEYYAKTAIGARAVEVLEKIAAMEATHE